MTIVRLQDVTRTVDEISILDSVSFEADEGEFVALVGPSGAGKTSTIRAIAGFDPVTSGSIHFDFEDVTRYPTQERDISIVTQDQTLFPTYSVRKNMAFPLLSRAFRRPEVDKRVTAESRALNIDHILDRWPNQLSTGQQQLAQIARSLVRVPRVFLMDEPLSNLDPPTRRKLREELVVLQRGYGVTTLYVATRAVEISTMADKVVALDHGRVVQVGTPAQLYDRPATRSIAELTGPIGWLTGTVTIAADRMVLSGPGFQVPLFAERDKLRVGQSITIGIRPQDLLVSANGPVEVRAAGTTYDGATVLRELRSETGMLITTHDGLSPGEQLRVVAYRYHAYGVDRSLLFSVEG